MPLTVSVTDRRGRPIRDYGLAAWLAATAPRSVRGVVSVALVSDADMRRMNRAFRHVDKATDVLSFPYGGGNSRSGGPESSGEVGHDNRILGELAIALGVARRQARAEKHSLSMELRVLALHGLLHLLGYDHERDSGQMHRLEERLRRRAGLPASLTGRAAGASGRSRARSEQPAKAGG